MTSKLPYQMIVFDLDGTLLDTWPGLIAAVRACLPEHAQALDETSLRLALSRGIDAVYAQAARQAGLAGEAADQAIARMAHCYVRHGLADAHPYGGAQAMLQALRSDGVALGLCTNRDRETTRTLLERMGWASWFAGVQCRDEGARPKPDPDPLLSLIGRLGGNPDTTLFVGDSRIDAECARAAGVDFAAHRPGYHARQDDLDPHVLAFDHHAELSAWAARRQGLPTEAGHG